VKAVDEGSSRSPGLENLIVVLRDIIKNDMRNELKEIQRELKQSAEVSENGQAIIEPGVLRSDLDCMRRDIEELRDEIRITGRDPAVAQRSNEP
jgi:hypothetical protein